MASRALGGSKKRRCGLGKNGGGFRKKSGFVQISGPFPGPVFGSALWVPLLALYRQATSGTVFGSKNGPENGSPKSAHFSGKNVFFSPFFVPRVPPRS